MIRRTPKRHPLLSAARVALFTSAVVAYLGLVVGAAVVAAVVFVPPALAALCVLGGVV